VFSIIAAWGVLKYARDLDERIDNCIMKLKAELAEKDAIIASLSSK
jgi:hypothetical protein